MSERKKIIVTGGMGYIGSHTVIELEQQGYETVIVDNLCNATIEVLDGIELILGYKPEFEHIDLRDKQSTLDVLEKHCDAVGLIHFAALKSVGESVDQPLEYYRNNIGSLVNVLDGMNKSNIPNLIFSSSCTVYGNATQLPVTELTPLQDATNPYGNTKQISEEIISDLINAGTNNLRCITLRYFNPIGAHSSAHIGENPVGIPNNLMPYITQTAIGRRKQLNVYGNDYKTKDGTAIRDYIHVVDLSKAHVKSMVHIIDNSQSQSYQVFNIGTGKGFTVLEVIQSFEKMSGLKLNYSFAERRKGDVEAIYADTQKVNSILGWHAELDLDDMTLSSWNWEKKLKK